MANRDGSAIRNNAAARVATARKIHQDLDRSGDGREGASETSCEVFNRDGLVNVPLGHLVFHVKRSDGIIACRRPAAEVRRRRWLQDCEGETESDVRDDREI